MPSIQDKTFLINRVKEVTDFICTTKKFTKLIPEVRTNIAVALPNATSLKEIAGVDGRITIVQEMPKCAGPISFGATNHTGRLLLAVKQVDPSINAVINIRYSPELIEHLSHTDLLLAEIDRSFQSSEISKTEDSSMSWIIQKIYEQHHNIPDIIWDTGEVGKEPMIRLFAHTTKELLDKIKLILTYVD